MRTTLELTRASVPTSITCWNSCVTKSNDVKEGRRTKGNSTRLHLQARHFMLRGHLLPPQVVVFVKQTTPQRAVRFLRSSRSKNNKLSCRPTISVFAVCRSLRRTPALTSTTAWVKVSPILVGIPTFENGVSRNFRLSKTFKDFC